MRRSRTAQIKKDIRGDVEIDVGDFGFIYLYSWDMRHLITALKLDWLPANNEYKKARITITKSEKGKFYYLNEFAYLHSVMGKDPPPDSEYLRAVYYGNRMLCKVQFGQAFPHIADGDRFNVSISFLGGRE